MGWRSIAAGLVQHELCGGFAPRESLTLDAPKGKGTPSENNGVLILNETSVTESPSASAGKSAKLVWQGPRQAERDGGLGPGESWVVVAWLGDVGRGHP